MALKVERNGRKFTLFWRLENAPASGTSGVFQIGHNCFVLEYSALADGKLNLKMTKQPTTSFHPLKSSLNLKPRKVSALSKSIFGSWKMCYMNQVSDDQWSLKLNTVCNIISYHCSVYMPKIVLFPFTRYV